MRLVYCLIAFTIVVSSPVFSSDASLKAVYVEDNEVYRMSGDGRARQLTSDGIPKRLPVFSQDGRKIAFMRETKKDNSLGDLVVIGDTGEQVADISLEPAGPTEELRMPYVESLQWVSADRIAVGGSDIYAAQVVVFDINNGREVDETDSQEINVVFSPDGKHFANFGGMAHFTPEEEREPEMDIDNQRIYPPGGGKIYFLKLNEPVWSQDSSKLAIAAKDEKAGKFVLIIWRTDGPLATIPLPVSWDDLDADLFWQANTLLVRTRQCVEKTVEPNVIGWDCKVSALAWKLSEDAKTLVTIPVEGFANAVAAAEQAEKEDENAILSLVKNAGGSDPDIWCKSCTIANRPRRATSP